MIRELPMGTVPKPLFSGSAHAVGGRALRDNWTCVLVAQLAPPSIRPANDLGDIMKLHRRTFLHLAAGATVLPALPHIAWAQAYPIRPVRVIVPFAAGGPTDVLARLISQKLSDRFGRQFYVENKPGAGSSIGTGEAARAIADGYTVLVTTDGYAINPTLFERIPYDPQGSFEPVTILATVPQVITVNPAVPAKTLGDLIALIKTNPGKYSFASPGTGTQPHLLGELLRLSLSIDLVHVPFGGGGPAAASVIAGHTPIYIGSPVPVLEQIRAGKLLAVAVTSSARAISLPDVQTTAEAGYSNVAGESWLGMLVPAGTPTEIVNTLNREARRVLELPDVKERLSVLGLQPSASSSEEFAQRIRVDVERWGTVIRAANIKPE